MSEDANAFTFPAEPLGVRSKKMLGVFTQKTGETPKTADVVRVAPNCT